MNAPPSRTWIRPVLVLLCMMCVVPLWGAAPEPVKVSAFASVEDLKAQIDQYMGRIEESLADADAFEAGATRITKDANTLIVLALSLGLHDEDNKLKASAPALIDAAGKLAQAGEDYEAAKAAFGQVQAAVAGQLQQPGELQWKKLASLGQLMKQVTFVNNRLKRGLRRFGRNAEQDAGDATMLAVIANAALYDTHEVKDPAQLDHWYEYCAAMRDAAAEVSAAIKADDEKACDAAMKSLAASCDDCHAVFRPDL